MVSSDASDNKECVIDKVAYRKQEHRLAFLAAQLESETTEKTEVLAQLARKQQEFLDLQVDFRKCIEKMGADHAQDIADMRAVSDLNEAAQEKEV